MDLHVMDALVTGYEPLIETIQLPDPKDRHVLAAAITGRADLIVTKNLKDFPAARLAPFGVQPQHPDVFIGRLLDLHEVAALAAVARHRASLRNPPKSADDYIKTLLVQGLPKTAAILRRSRDRI